MSFEQQTEQTQINKYEAMDVKKETSETLVFLSYLLI